MQMQPQVMKDAIDTRLESQVRTVEAPELTAMSAKEEVNGTGRGNGSAYSVRRNNVM